MRPVDGTSDGTAGSGSLPLMRKTFIEAPSLILGVDPLLRLFRLCGRLSLRRGSQRLIQQHRPHTSLPLMRKTFIEAGRCSLHSSRVNFSLFRLCGRLSLRLPVIVTHHERVYVRLFRLCGRLSLRHPRRRRYASYGCAVSSAYAEDFH